MSRRLANLGLIAIAALGVGCASPTVKLIGRPAGRVSLPLRGVYTATVRAPFIGPVRGQLTAEPTPTGFAANSRPGIAWSMIGGFQGFLGQIFTPFLFPSGVIVTWTSSVPEGTLPGEGWLGIGGIRAVGVKTRMTSADGPIDLLTPEGRRAATLTLTPSGADEPPLADYPALATRIDAAFRERIFDRDLTSTSGVRAYLSQLTSSAKLAHDDVEFIFGSVVAARNNVKFSLPITIPRAAGGLSDPENPELATVRATFDQRSHIATLKVEAFLDAADVDLAFEKILNGNPSGLIIDLRNCPGVTLASLRTACWLLDKPTDAGFFYGPASRADALAGRTDAFQRAEINSAAAVAETEATLDSRGAVTVIIQPESRRFTGPVAVLISKRTTTSAEPLVWLLKSTGRARIFGAPTVGRPTLSRPIDIGQGWDYWLPAFDYSPAVGDRFNDKGIKPDVEGGRDSSRFAAWRWIRDQNRPQPGPNQTETPASE